MTPRKGGGISTSNPTRQQAIRTLEDRIREAKNQPIVPGWPAENSYFWHIAFMQITGRRGKAFFILMFLFDHFINNREQIESNGGWFDAPEQITNNGLVSFIPSKSSLKAGYHTLHEMGVAESRVVGGKVKVKINVIALVNRLNAQGVFA